MQACRGYFFTHQAIPTGSIALPFFGGGRDGGLDVIVQRTKFVVFCCCCFLAWLFSSSLGLGEAQFGCSSGSNFCS